MHGTHVAGPDGIVKRDAGLPWVRQPQGRASMRACPGPLARCRLPAWPPAAATITVVSTTVPFAMLDWTGTVAVAATSVRVAVRNLTSVVCTLAGSLVGLAAVMFASQQSALPSP